MRRTSLILAAVIAVACAHAQTENTNGMRYKWRDGQGLPHYSDSLTSDAIKYGYDVVNDRGLVIQHVERQLNPEERAAARKASPASSPAPRSRPRRYRCTSARITSLPARWWRRGCWCCWCARSAGTTATVRACRLRC